MTSKVKSSHLLPDSKMRLTIKELAEMQALSSKHLSFSVTLSCPLSCDHCIVKSGPRENQTMTIRHAEHYASQMKELYDYGIRSLGFTGGEPTLAARQINIISKAAVEAGINCGLVTSGYFAKNEKAVQDMVDKLPAIEVWDLSVDAYHEKFVSREMIKLAYETIKKLGRKPNLRFTFHIPMSRQDHEIFNYLVSFSAPEDLLNQRIRKAGRALNIDMESYNDNTLWTKPCMTQGLLIRYDGSVSPCCCSLVEERNHPFQFGSAYERRIIDIHRDYSQHSLFQHIRLLGFAEIMRWMAESELFDELPKTLPDDICDLCPILFTNEKIGNFINEKASKPENVFRLAVLAFKVFGETGMLKSALEKYEHEKFQIVDYELAMDILNNPEKYSYYY